MAIDDRVSMFFGAKPDIFRKAEQLRKGLTNAEMILWNVLKDSKRIGAKFRRQHPIDIFIVDFYCHPLKLVIEVDGGYHLDAEQKEYDNGREEELRNLGLRTIRFTNEEIVNDLEKVVRIIEKEITKGEEG
jgi:very-short-patch-repair endonuclease